MLEVLLLGTAGSSPTRERNLVATLVICGEDRFMIDCSEGTQRQILQSGRGCKGLSKILISHSHLDHFLGLAGLIFTLDKLNVVDSVKIMANAETQRDLSKLLSLLALEGNLIVRQETINTGVVYEDERLKCLAFQCFHTKPCYGFIFEEKKRRRFLKEKADELHIPEGPLRKRLIQGGCVELPDGTQVTPDMVLSPPRAGLKLVYISDSAFSDTLIETCRGANVVIAEATFLDKDKALAKQYKHLTAREAAYLAKEAKVGRLILNHVSSRYKCSQIAEEAKQIFPATQVAEDFDVVTINE